MSIRKKWIAATNAAQEALDLIGNVPGLKEGMFTNNNTPLSLFGENIIMTGSWKILIFHRLDYGNGYTSPSQNLINSFPAKNGYPIDSP